MNITSHNENLSTDDDVICVTNGDIEVRLARTVEEIEAGQALRYQVFFEELGANPSDDVKKQSRDFDQFDDICDHLLAFDNSKKGPDKVVATYRLLREEVINGPEDFYSSTEFDLSNLYNEHFRTLIGDRQLLELGRSCVKFEYRTNAIMQLMWRFIARYVDKHKVAYLFGCASMPGVDIENIKLPLTHLYHNYKTPDEYNIPAIKSMAEDMNYYPADEYDKKAALRALAPLVKGYLRLGCFVGDGAVIDRIFNSIDVFILLPIDRLESRYLSLFDDK
ncbi:MAG: GNAT family N-acetyltransferase [Kordiimonadaceae bacterium]|nr:GNAT family N-acetyltransferase [Kordiimonadaceae bacterium]MBT6031996.1 GNAT family N-acetyltransferase [Kordiimonadaceae bacterium]